MRTGQGRKIPVIIHRQSPAAATFNPSLLSPTIPRSKELSVLCDSALSQEVTNGLRSAPTKMGSTWKSRWSLLGQHSLAVTKHMFILCLQPGQSRTGEVRACTESEDSLRPPSPNEGFVGDDQDQPYWRMLWKSDISAFCLKALCQHSVLCMGHFCTYELLR